MEPSFLSDHLWHLFKGFTEEAHGRIGALKNGTAPLVERDAMLIAITRTIRDPENAVKHLQRLHEDLSPASEEPTAEASPHPPAPTVEAVAEPSTNAPQEPKQPTNPSTSILEAQLREEESLTASLRSELRAQDTRSDRILAANRELREQIDGAVTRALDFASFPSLLCVIGKKLVYGASRMVTGLAAAFTGAILVFSCLIVGLMLAIGLGVWIWAFVWGTFYEDKREDVVDVPGGTGSEGNEQTAGGAEDNKVNVGERGGNVGNGTTSLESIVKDIAIGCLVCAFAVLSIFNHWG